ncbi:unnamed protein product, partial [Allacma fusca]
MAILEECQSERFQSGENEIQLQSGKRVKFINSKGEAVPLTRIGCLPLTDGGLLQVAGQQQLQCEQGREHELQSSSHIKNLECNEQIPVQSPVTLSIPVDDNPTAGTASVDILGSVQQTIEAFDLEALQAQDVEYDFEDFDFTFVNP